MFERFKHRSTEKERLDTGDYTPAEYALWQKEMRYIHGWFGEERAMRSSMLPAIADLRQDRVSVLDVGAGSGSLLSKLTEWIPGRSLSLTGVEMSLDAARSIKSHALQACIADGLQLPFSDGSFDYAYCTLLLHHLDEEDAILLLREMARVSRSGVFVFDLNRDPTSYYAYLIFGRLALQRFTLEDGALSILRSYTADEMMALAMKAGLSNAKVTRSRLNRLILFATR
jgi:ubiquinone/menaquinone biosynthesis C-methylase UbiE